MASKQDILTSIKNLNLFLKVPELKGASARINKNGNPFAFVGGFNMVFQITHNLKKWAFRVWHVPMGENKERYLKISNYLIQKDLPYFAEFIYDEKGILVNGELLDTIRMEWLDGILLKDYLEINLDQAKVLNTLADNFLKMCQDLHENKISHGDLQEGNILIDKVGNIKLVDYDSICIPEIEGQQELVTGLKGYQHPSRFKGGKTSLNADYFSELIIYISIKAIAENPELWSKYQIKDTQYLLFSENDFEDFENSIVYNDLQELSPQIKKLLSVLNDYLKIPFFTDLKPFITFLQPPTIKLFESNKEVLIQGSEINISWEVDNALEVSINNGINGVESKGSISIKPKDNLEFTLTAKGYNESVSKKIELRVFPTPLIKSIQVPIPIFEKTTNLKLTLPQFPNIELGINNFSSSLNLNLDTSVMKTVEQIKFQKLDKGFNHLNVKTGRLEKLSNYIISKNLLSKISKNQSNEQN